MICNPVVNSVSTPINSSMQGVVGSVPHHHTPTLEEEMFAGIDLKSKIDVHTYSYFFFCFILFFNYLFYSNPYFDIGSC